MAPVSRETVVAAVEEYGLAWTTQDVGRIGALFTHAAVYVERAFDRKATFRGRDAIMAYWRYQVCGKQSNIQFRHLGNEMVRDADEPIAVVKWLAEFDNQRVHRADKAYKRVCFCQMAKLIFDGDRISYLEEYAQGMGSSRGVVWPDIVACSDQELWECLCNEPPKPPTPVVCNVCSQTFPSRTKLFVHIQGVHDTSSESDEKEADDVLICLSVSYTCSDPERKLKQALATLYDATASAQTLIWAVPLEFSDMAVANVVTTKLPRTVVEDIVIDRLSQRLNEILQEMSSDIMVHAAGVVSTVCAPERRENEKYVVYLPWKIFGSKEEGKTLSNEPSSDTNGSFNDSAWRVPLEHTMAASIVDVSVIQRIRNATRLMICHSDDGTDEDIPYHKQTLRIRTSIMKEPLHRYAKVSLSLRQSKAGEVAYLVGLLISHVRCELTDDELVAATTTQSDVVAIPCALVVLVEPNLTRYENKFNLKLTRNNRKMVASTTMTKSLNLAEEAVLGLLDGQEDILNRWMATRE